jgi:hypothetical protein
MLPIVVAVEVALLRLHHRLSHHRTRRLTADTLRSDRGQTTTEYALVTLGAAAVALLVTAWAGRTGKIGHLLDAVVDRVIGQM